MDAPRLSTFARVLPWIGALVLAAGTAAFLLAFFRDPDAPSQAPQPAANVRNATPPANNTKAGPKTAKVDPAARRVAGKFILTAVARKNLAASWPIIHPDLKRGYTLAEWKKGEIPIVPYPLEGLEQARFTVDESYEDQVLLQVALIPKPGVKVDAAVFFIGLKASGKGANKRWLVDYWMPRWSPPVPDNPD